jgi:hypothetical protein
LIFADPFLAFQLSRVLFNLLLSCLLELAIAAALDGLTAYTKDAEDARIYTHSEGIKKAMKKCDRLTVL